MDKPLYWFASSRDEISAFPPETRRTAGYQLRRVQQGLDPTDWKPMKAVGPGVREIRIHKSGEHRVFYVARFSEGVYVLYAFEKRARKTPDHAIDLGRSRYRDLLDFRRRQGHEA